MDDIIIAILRSGTPLVYVTLAGVIAQQLDETIEKRLGLTSGHGVVEARPTALSDRPREGELRHREDPAADLVESAIHPALLVLEDPQGRNPASGPIDLVLAITPLEAHENHEPEPDGADNSIIDPNRGAGHPLDHELHSDPPVLNVETKVASSRPPSRVTPAT